MITTGGQSSSAYCAADLLINDENSRSSLYTAESPAKSGGVLMQVTRRGFLKAGVAAGAAMALPSSGLFTQPTPLLQKKIPSSGENVPIIGIGTARRYEEIKTT